MDRDVVAVMNIATKGGEVFHRSKGLAGEAMKGESDDYGNPQSRCKQADF
jgi:transposase